ncbi:LysE family translocator [Ahrensia marina]|jgi:threonine/homoserine/homoserine lactone efflux protein|uniref:LysE family translocator n=1 Tax=Ahrensia marina TaxID=1514904 RepID=UPI0035CFA540
MFEFIPSLATLAAFSLAAIALTLTPGPDMTLFLGQTVANGRRAGFMSMAGASSGIIVHSLAAAIGLSALIAASPQAFEVLKWVGAAYLAYLAYEVLRHGSGLTGDGPPKSNSLKKAYMKGLTINLLNPKIILFFVTFLPQFVSPTDPHASGKLMFLGLFFLVIAIPMVIPMILGAERISGFLRRSKRATRIFDWLFAGVMGGFALKLLATQAR